ncbi:MAG: dienelactone hydrolase family protein [Pseudomonadota bacterium]
MAIQEQYLDYELDGKTYEAYVAWEDSRASAPGVLVSHAWAGRGDFENKAARWLASKGYVGFALDMYGKGIRGSSTEENSALMTPLVEDRPQLQRRISGAFEVLQGLDMVDASKSAAMGFCFGGLCVLDLARVGTNVGGVISIHGLFNAPENTAGISVTAKVLCLHGYDDPMAPPDSVLALATEMTEAGADWQLHAYGQTMHAFTNPEANDPEFGTVYSPLADARAHQSIENFLAELFT